MKMLIELPDEVAEKLRDIAKANRRATMRQAQAYIEAAVEAHEAGQARELAEAIGGGR